MNRYNKGTVVFDFDGVIHSYSSGWQGISIANDPPVDGIAEALKQIHQAGYKIVVVSSRCNTSEGRSCVNDYLLRYNMLQYVELICAEKPPAVVYVDDRAICFDGNPGLLLSKIKSFKPWYQKHSKSKKLF